MSSKEPSRFSTMISKYTGDSPTGGANAYQQADFPITYRAMRVVVR